MEPPTNYVYDKNAHATDPKQAAYPNSNYAALKNPSPMKKVTWVPANTIKDESGDTTRTAEYIAQGYYICESQAFLASYKGCGDGVPSNGPPPESALNKKITRSN